jgi:hypothetical protein
MTLEPLAHFVVVCHRSNVDLASAAEARAGCLKEFDVVGLELAGKDDEAR